ncbi:trypsin-like peptidase domain-containing protein [Streptomyces sp. ISL-43]|uniref:trypsin-like serine peptidase n=1 Tax=Streptomyces sp. ISL-43 TaxID=2819183 RepID=UPI001BE94CCD|nr:serine protease [Streptomyces sp. ISL-43]MBT2446539.1 trypsin-like peptidase domain-containing protein [Streptomyces sp. ISL-43]
MFTKVRGRAVRGFALSGICCALLLGGAGYVWGLRGLAGYVAEGDPGRGRYVQDPRSADSAVVELLDGVAGGEDSGKGGAAEPLPAGSPGPPGSPDSPISPDSSGHSELSVRSEPSGPPTAGPVPAEPAVGALFSPGADGDPGHHCSAGVVHSPGGDLIVTAAHCVHTIGFRTNLVFAPGYHDGAFPYGVWVPTRIHVDPRWTAGRDPDHDVAFVRVRRPGHPGERLEDVTGAAWTLRFGTELPVPARLVGYPNTSERPLACLTRAVAAGPAQLRLDCPDVPNGTSGGPVLTDGDALIGVIGGRDGGGDDETSYSSSFDGSTRELYERAVSG